MNRLPFEIVHRILAYDGRIKYRHKTPTALQCSYYRVCINKGNLRFPLTSILGWDALGHPNQKEVYPIQCILSK